MIVNAIVMSKLCVTVWISLCNYFVSGRQNVNIISDNRHFKGILTIKVSNVLMAFKIKYFFKGIITRKMMQKGWKEKENIFKQ